MKKFLLCLSFVFFQAAPFAFGQEGAAAETPASLYEKVAAKSYFGKFNTIIIDKDIASTDLPSRVKVKSRTYFSKDKAREETFLSDPLGVQLNFITIFTKQNTFVSYDSGINFHPLNEILITRVTDIVQKADYFSPSDSKISKNLYDLNGKKCYVIGENYEDLQKLTFIEKDSYLILRISVPNGKDERIVTDMSEYKKVKDFYVPFKIRVAVENLKEKTSSVSEIKITDFKTGLGINPSLFTPSNVSDMPDIPGFNIRDLLKSIL
jgi:hypothetical protein